MSMSVCLSVRMLNSKTMLPNFNTFFEHVACGCGSVSSDGVAICYLLPVLWMTSCCHTHGIYGQTEEHGVV